MSKSGFGDRFYCSKKCRDEAEAGEDEKKAAKQAAREEEEYESEGSSSSSSSGSGGMGVIGNVIGGVVLVLLLIIVLAALFSKDEDANDPAVKMAKWEEHLEKRRAAFAEGLPEKGIEERGLKNYTWEEWQNRGQNASKKSKEGVKRNGVFNGDGDAMSQAYTRHVRMRMDFCAAGHTESETQEVGLFNWTFDEFKAKFKDPEAAEAALDKVKARVEEIKEEAKARAEAKARLKAEAEAKRDAEAKRRAEELERKRAEAKVRAEAEARLKAEAEAKRREEAKRRAEEAERKRAEAKARAEAESRIKAEKEAKRLAEEMARKEAEAKSRAEAGTRVKAKTEADAKPKGSTVAEGAVVGQQGRAVHKASKDSKAIRIEVQGKGKTKEAAVRWALRDAVWKTVGTWVDSRTRIQENRDKLVAQVKTITEADVPKFEVVDTQMQDGGFVVKVKVSVSKKKIAPKFAEIFPDVFGNVND